MQDHVSEAVTHIRKFTSLEPKAGIILGSGLGSFADTLDDQ